MASAEDSHGPQARMILQQCISARLQIAPAQGDEEPAKFVEIQRGLIVYVCFMKAATETIVEKLAKIALQIRLSESPENSKLTSVLDLPGDILIIPQATLGGRMKGKVMQYHNNIAKDKGQELYSRFVSLCSRGLQESDKAREAGCVVQCGTYGNRQVLSTETNGPYTHMIELP